MLLRVIWAVKQDQGQISLFDFLFCAKWDVSLVDVIFLHLNTYTFFLDSRPDFLLADYKINNFHFKEYNFSHNNWPHLFLALMIE